MGAGYRFMMLLSVQLVRDCCITIAYLAQEIGYKVGDYESASVGLLFSRVFKSSFISSQPSFNYFSTGLK